MWASMGVWWAYELCYSRQLYQPSPVFTCVELLNAMRAPGQPIASLPSDYDLSRSPADVSGIAQNGVGWTHPTGETQGVVVLFTRDPGPMVVELAVEDAPNQPFDVTAMPIRAKVGLHPLKLEEATAANGGWLLRFSPPEAGLYSEGCQVVFLAFPYDGDRWSRSPFRLIRVQWENEAPQSAGLETLAGTSDSS
jgi:hypothetical protein